MKSLALATLLFLLLGCTAAAFAQEQHDEDARPAPRQEEMKPAPHPETVAPAPRQDEAKPTPHPQEERAAPHPEEARPAPHPEQSRPVPQPEAVRPVPQNSHPPEQPAHQTQGGHPQPTPEQRQVQQTAWQSHRAQHWQSEHRTWQQRGGYHGYRIPDDRYRQYFGPSHVFAVYTVPVVVYGGYPRFQYGGLWFRWLIHGRNIGRRTGTIPTMSTSFSPTVDIIW